VDQDQSDNVVTTFLILGGHVLSQNTAAQAAKRNSTLITNGSDNGLVDVILDPVLGCTPWQAKTVTNSAGITAALALNELQAAMFPPKIPALVPLTDPMVLVNNAPSLQKTNLYRAGVGQPPAVTAADADGIAYCKNFAIAGLFIQNNKNLFSGQASPATDTANNLYTFMAQRFGASLTNLNCLQGLNIAQPVNMTTDANGVVTAANINLTQLQKIVGGTVASSSSVSASRSVTAVTKPTSVSVPVKVSSASSSSVSASHSVTAVTKPTSISVPVKVSSVSAPSSIKHISSSKLSTLSKVAMPSISLPTAIQSSLIAAASSTMAAISSSIAAAGSGGLAPSKALSSTAALPSCTGNPYQQLANGLLKNTQTGQFYFQIPPQFAQFLNGGAGGHGLFRE
jgi:hypothetical protein